MIELDHSEYHYLKPIFHDRLYYVEIPMIVNQRRGRAWVDNKDNPHLGILHCGEMIFIEGDGEPDHVVEPVLEIAERTLEVCCDRRFGDALGKGFPKIQPMSNLMFIHDGTQYRHDVISGFELRKLDEELYSKLGETGENWLVSMYEDYKDFKNTCGYGYAVVKDEKVVSAATAFGFDGKRADIGVATNPEFRNLGLSKACTSKLIGELRANGIGPVWITTPDNIASKTVAEENGFYVEFEFPTFWTRVE
jgi:ribosomal protein S18 acetylase RimI-like enzyme